MLYLTIVLKEKYIFMGGNSVNVVLPPFWKEVYFKAKNWLFPGNKFFPFNVDPFSEGTYCAGKQTENHKSCLPPKKWQIIRFP